MPPMPPPGGMAGPAAAFFGSSAIMASVVIRSVATEAARRDRHGWFLGPWEVISGLQVANSRPSARLRAHVAQCRSCHQEKCDHGDAADNHGGGE